jgi:RNA polymerase sigma-B factor
MDLQADENSPIDGLEDKILLQKAMENLKYQQQEILKLRFNEGKTQTEIADTIGVSQMHVSRLLRRAIDDLRRQLGEMDEPEDEALGTPQPRELENRA